MNLMKLFNFSFFKENLKKSKGLLAFFLGVVPLINILILIVNCLDREIILFDFTTISITTFLGLYIIPIILALSLFSFVFKQKSVDFVLSKPLSRGVIYFTNIVGGIIVLGIFMLLNTLIYSLFSLFIPKFIIPFSLILDYFIFWFISLIFVFIVSSLAISFAGNIMGSIVVIMLLTFMYPSIVLINNFFTNTNNTSYYIKCENNSCKPKNYSCDNNLPCKRHLTKNEYRAHADEIISSVFTTPSYILNNDDEALVYNSSSIIKMLILSFVYAVIGYYVFIKRKMENSEISFKNERMHYLVKILTMIPICFILYVILKSGITIGLLVDIVLILIYSILYDLITRKEIYRFVVSSFITLISMGVLLGYYAFKDYYSPDVIINSIDEIKYNNSITITDKNLINSILADTLEDNHEQKGYTYYKVKSGHKYYNLGLYISNNNMNKINELEYENYLNTIKNYDYKHIAYLDNRVLVTKEIRDLIKKTMLDYHGNIPTEKMFTSYVYYNHHYEELKVPYALNKELDKIILKELNKKSIDIIKNHNQELYMSVINSEFDNNSFNYTIEKNIDSFIKYLERENYEFGANYLTINFYYLNAYHNLLIADKDKFMKEYTNYIIKLNNDPYYQELLGEPREEEVFNEY